MASVQLSVFLLLTLLLSVSYAGYLTPQHVEQHIKRLISQRYQLYVINLGTTVNSNPLKAYVITGIKKQQTRISELRDYPATLITSFMHPREPYSVKQMQTFLDEVLNNYNSDYFFRYMLDHSLLILFPFVNIDGYYLQHKLTDEGASQATKEQYRKNRNMYGKCLMDWQYGVDINRNFDSSWGSLRTSDNECGQEYRGPSPFSEKQTKAVRTLFNKFKINLAVDIHSYGNQWIYPYASQSSNSKLQNNQLYPLYKDLFEEFKEAKRPMKSCYESLGYTADGVYIDWALDQGALSFAVEIGTSFSDDVNVGNELLFQAETLFHKVLKKNSISFNKYMTRSNEIVIVSTSLLDFAVKVSYPNGKEIGEQDLLTRKFTVFEIQEGTQKVIIHIKNTKVEEVIEVKNLKLIDTSDIPDYSGNMKMYMLKKILKAIIIVISCLGIAGGIYLLFCKNKNSQKVNLSTLKNQGLWQNFDDKIQSTTSTESDQNGANQNKTKNIEQNISLTQNASTSEDINVEEGIEELSSNRRIA